MNLLDALLASFTVQNNGVAVPRRRTLNFLGVTVADDVPNERTNVTTAAGSSDFGSAVVQTTGALKALGALYLATGIVNATSYTVAANDCILLVDTSVHATTINMPAHSLGQIGRIIFVKDWKASASLHAITVHRFGGTGKINGVPADLSLGVRGQTILVSDGVDNWLDLQITGT
jgi:hypothetical protein